MLDWGDNEDMDSDGSGTMDYQVIRNNGVGGGGGSTGGHGQMFTGGLDIPSDNDVSCMVEEYLTKDATTLVDEDWASVVDEAIYMITNPDHHQQMSMSGTMNSSPTMDLNYSGMYGDISQAHSLSGHTHQQLQQPQTHHHQHQQQQQLQSQQHMQLSNYDCYQQQQQQPLYQHEPTRLNGHVQQYLDHQFSQQLNLHHDQYSSGQQLNMTSQNGGYYDNQPVHSQTQQPMEHFSQTSPVYYVAQTVGKIPAPENSQTSFNFEQFASLPTLNTSTNLHHVRMGPGLTSRNHSSSSAGNSPSSQSPVSEEEYHEPPPPKIPATKRKPETAAPPKKPKATAKQRRRKRDPNEPTKPVSAYALFFRDKQANIKGSKPDATFGEVSKIVAQMWDNLDPEKKAMYKRRTEDAKKDYLQQLAVYRASLLSSPDSSMYIQTNFASRSSPVQMTSYNRPIYSSVNTLHNNGHPIKTHLQPFPPQSHMTSRSPPQMPQEDCLQMTQVIGNEGQVKIENNFGHVYARVVEPDAMKNGYLTQMNNIWDAQVVSEGDGLVAHCKNTYPSWLTGQQATNSNGAKVVI